MIRAAARTDEPVPDPVSLDFLRHFLPVAQRALFGETERQVDHIRALVDPDGRRVAVELELSRKGRARRDAIFFGYSLERRIDAVLYLVETPSMARTIQAMAKRHGISNKVHVQYVRAGDGDLRAGGRSRAAAARTATARGTARPAPPGASRAPEPSR